MKVLKRIAALLCALILTLGVVPAHAAESWHTPYLNVLKQGMGSKRVAMLIDLTNDGTPELIVLKLASTGATLHAWGIKGDGAAQLSAASIDALKLKGISKLSAQLRATSEGAPSLSLAITAQSGTTRTNARLGLTQADAGNPVKLALMAGKQSGGAARYTVDGDSVSADAHARAISSYETQYAKKGAVPMVTLNGSLTAAAIKTKFTALAKRYTAFATARKVKLNKEKLLLTTGDTFKLTAKITPVTALSKAATFSTSDLSIATVGPAGKVTAVGAGEAVITAQTESGARATCIVRVTDPAPVAIALSATSLTLVKGETHTLTATGSAASGKLTWSSGNPKVALVDQSGKVTALTVGKAAITVKTASGKTATCKVVVNNTNAVIVDISQHNYSTKMDWAKIAKSVDLLILRCGVTRTETAPIGVGKDDKFAFYAQQCKAYGIPFGVYFYGKCSDVATAREEARMTWSVASPYKPLFYVYDAEEARLTKTLIEAYITELKSLGAKKTGYYIAHHRFSAYKLDISLVDFIWLPHYGKNNGTVNSTPSYACDLHQYTSQGKVAGFPGVVDVNRLMGKKSLAWFLS